VSEARALSALLASANSHKSPHVRCRAAAHLDEVAAGGQGLEGLLRGNNWSLLDRLFKWVLGHLRILQLYHPQLSCFTDHFEGLLQCVQYLYSRLLQCR
jgi:hypothetical protein